MPPLSDVSITLGNNNLGRPPANEDGVCGLVASGVAVGGQFALGDVLGPFRSIQDAHAKGITQAYDVANTCLVWHHLNDFFRQAGDGNPIYVMVVAKTVTLAQQADNTLTHAKKLLTTAGGKIRFVGLTRVPQGGYTATYADSLDTDITGCLNACEVLQAAEFAAHRPVRFVVEGRDWQGNASSSLDLTSATTGTNTNVAMLVLGQNTAMAAAHAEATKHAAVGLMLGTLASIPVHYSAARVKNGALYIDQLGLSNGSAIEAMSGTDLNTLNDKGYVFPRIFTDLPGKYWNADSCACPVTDDFHLFNRGRVIDKAARIVYATYVTELLDDVEIDQATGKLSTGTCKSLQGLIERQVSSQMAGEITAVSAYVDENQNVLATDTIAVQVNVIPRGIARNITVTLQFSNPFN